MEKRAAPASSRRRAHCHAKAILILAQQQRKIEKLISFDGSKISI